MRTLALTIALLAPFGLAGAEHYASPECSRDGTPALGIIEVGGGSAESTFYVIDDASTLHVYHESNGQWTSGASGHDNLQRSDDQTHPNPDLPPGCADPDAEPDTQIL